MATGAGYLPMEEMVKQLCEDGYDAYFAIEHFDAENQWDTIQQSAENLHRWLEA